MTRHIHIVKVHHLTLAFPTGKDPDPKPVLDDVDFGIRDGEILGLIGNSGSGKTMTSLAIAGLLPAVCRMSSGDLKLLRVPGISCRYPCRAWRGVPSDPSQEGLSLQI